MINGNSVIAQLGLETTYGTAVNATNQFKIASESLKPVYNKIDEGLATGGRGAGLKATMGIGVEGALSTLMRGDMGYILAGALGVESVAGTDDGEGGIIAPYTHTYTAIASDEDEHLPAFTVKVDRKVDQFAYTGCKINSLTLSASAGDYLKADINLVGRDETTGATMQTLSPSSLKAFKFAQGKMYTVTSGVRTEIADVDNVSVEINNNLDYQTQTTSTGDHYAQAEVGTREINVTAEAIYSTDAESIRNTYYKSDATVGIDLEFISDEMASGTTPYKLTISLPCCQLSDADANMGGLDTLKQNMTFNVVDNLTDELITIALVNADANASIN